MNPERRRSTMPRLPELTMEIAPPTIRKMMEAQQATYGAVLNPLKLMGYCPTIAEGQAALARGIEQAGHIEARLRYLLYTFVATLNGCPF
jgi:hypothetical protein